MPWVADGAFIAGPLPGSMGLVGGVAGVGWPGPEALGGDDMLTSPIC
jgi:hypothetical protein